MDNTSTTLRVLSVHDHVVNFAAEAWPHLFMLCDSSVHRGPASVGLSRHQFHMLLDILDSPQSCRIDAGEVHIVGVHGSLSILLSGPKISFYPPLPPGKGNMPCFADLEQALPCLQKLAQGRLCSVLFDNALAYHSGEQAEGLDFGTPIRAAFPQVLDALLDNDMAALDYWAGRMVGLGFGSTPTGDDLLHGALVAWHYLQRLHAKSPVDICLPESLLKLTTSLGAHMLVIGGRGLTPEPVGTYLYELCSKRYSNPTPSAEGVSSQTLGDLAGIGSDTGINIAVGAFLMIRNFIDSPGFGGDEQPAVNR